MTTADIIYDGPVMTWVLDGAFWRPTWRLPTVVLVPWAMPDPNVIDGYTLITAHVWLAFTNTAQM